MGRRIPRKPNCRMISSPLIEPDVRISRIRLSDRLHRKAHDASAKHLVPCEETRDARPGSAARTWPHAGRSRNNRTCRPPDGSWPLPPNVFGSAAQPRPASHSFQRCIFDLRESNAVHSRRAKVGIRQPIGAPRRFGWQLPRDRAFPRCVVLPYQRSVPTALVFLRQCS